MDSNILEKLGLSSNESKLYLRLLEQGRAKASDLVSGSGLGRANIYAILLGLQVKGLVNTIETGKIQLFQASDPNQLNALIEQKKSETDLLASELQVKIPQLTSIYNLTTGRPAIQVYEGEGGFKTVLIDSIKSKTEILTIIDPRILTPELQQIERDYVSQRVKLGITKRIIIPSNPENRAAVGSRDQTHTSYRYLDEFPPDLITATEIYLDTSVFITIQGNTVISLLVKDRNITALQKLQFEKLWQIAKP